MVAVTAAGRTETDEQLCQVNFAPLGKGNLSVGEEKKVTGKKQKRGAKEKKTSGVKAASCGGGVGRVAEGRVIAPGCTQPTLRYLTSPPSA